MLMMGQNDVDKGTKSQHILMIKVQIQYKINANLQIVCLFGNQTNDVFIFRSEPGFYRVKSSQIFTMNNSQGGGSGVKEMPHFL